MDLFIINRYKEEEDIEQSVNQETLNLQRLKQRIEERKRARQTNENKVLVKIEDAVEVSTEVVKTEKAEVQHGKNENAVETQRKIQELEISQQIEEKSEETQSNIDTSTQPKKADFQVLGIKDFEKKIKVKRVLPYWLSHPVTVAINLQNLTVKIEEQEWLHPHLKHTLKADGMTFLFPVQEKLIPFIINGNSKPPPYWPNDICVSAPTGSGKTLAFVLPIIQVLMDTVGRYVKALIVLPVQELAAQVAKVFTKYCGKTGLKVALLSGAVPLQQEQNQLIRHTETSGWQSEVDIIVCTAGRLVEHLHKTEGFTLKKLRFLVIDEADRIMDHIQNDWLYHLDRNIKLENSLMTGKIPLLSTQSIYAQKRPPQKLLFSATLSQDPEKLEQWGLFQPKLFSSSLELRTSSNEERNAEVIRKYTTPAELSEKCILCEAEEKPLALYHLLTDQKWDRVLCFTNAAESAHRLAVLLNNLCEGELKVAEISSALNRTNRDLVLKKFHAGEINVLVSTDALARGIDISNCDYVISYDPPKNIKTYIHRVGRTGRAGKLGTAVTILLQNQMPLFKDLLQSGGKNQLPLIDIDTDVYENLIQKYEMAIRNMKQHIHNEVNMEVKKSKALKRGYNLANQGTNFHMKKRKFNKKSNKRVVNE